jgi:GNAT superfamily N-acetyltransferase
MDSRIASAVDSGQQGRWYSGLLVSEALKKALAASRQIASVVVDAVRFYLKYGFVEFPVVPMKLYMAIDEIEKSIRSK